MRLTNKQVEERFWKMKRPWCMKAAGGLFRVSIHLAGGGWRRKSALADEQAETPHAAMRAALAELDKRSKT